MAHKTSNSLMKIFELYLMCTLLAVLSQSSLGWASYADTVLSHQHIGIYAYLFLLIYNPHTLLSLTHDSDCRM